MAEDPQFLPTAAQMHDQSSQMTAAEFRFVTDLVHRSTGILIESHKRQMVHARIARRLRALDIDNFADYLEYLSSTPAETEHFINSLTTNLTSFFREAHHFDYLRDQIIANQPERLRIWSSACSTGEEPYSAALVASNIINPLKCNLKILSTDIDSSALEVGRAGVYSLDKRKAIPEIHHSELQTQGENFAFPEKIKNIISFKRLNLLESWPIRVKFDYIFCRNVIIYFDHNTKALLIKSLVEALADGGILFLGHSETINASLFQLESIGKTIYKKKG